MPKFRHVKSIGPRTAMVPSPMHDRKHKLDSRGEGVKHSEGKGGTWLRARVPESYHNAGRRALILDFEHNAYRRLASPERGEKPRLWGHFIQVPKRKGEPAYHVLRLRGNERRNVYRVSLNEMITMRRRGLKTPARVPKVERGEYYKDEMGRNRYKYNILSKPEESLPILDLHKDVAAEALSHLRTRKGKTPGEKELEGLLKKHVEGSRYWFSSHTKDHRQGELF